MIDYSEYLVKLQPQSRAIEEAMNHKQWDVALVRLDEMMAYCWAVEFWIHKNVEGYSSEE